jgi:hypothetical protein
MCRVLRGTPRGQGDRLEGAQHRIGRSGMIRQPRTFRACQNTGGQSRGMAAAKPSQSGMVGMAMIASMMRWMMLSIQPP